MRLVWLFLVLAILFLVPFLIWGERLGELFSQEGAVAWLEGYGRWAWAAGIVLLILDIVLPLPSTVVISALGYLYGALWGGLIAALGSMLSAGLAYGLCRTWGRRAARWIAGERGVAEGERLFGRAGGWIVVLSRWLPLMPEVVSCMAGIARMRAWSFFFALACGTLPMAFVFAWVGSYGREEPWIAFVLSISLPVLLWGIFRVIWGRRPDGGEDGQEGIGD
ncbi:MAG: VTT domain-containing protein [Verrucomicrobiota bacterium]